VVYREPLEDAKRIGSRRSNGFKLDSLLAKGPFPHRVFRVAYSSAVT